MISRIDLISKIRKKLNSNLASIGGWIQIPHPSVAEILGQFGYDWVAIDLEHGSTSHHQLPDLFRAIELGETLPIVRVAEGSEKDCKQALDAGAGGVIVPKIESASQLEYVRDMSRWPPEGIRGVGYSRANLFGEFFEKYRKEALSPILIAMIESKKGLENLDEILKVRGLDAILIGPYDLSASMGITGDFDNVLFQDIMQKVLAKSVSNNVPVGIHVVEPSFEELDKRIGQGFRFLPFSIDSVMLRSFSKDIRRRNN